MLESGVHILSLDGKDIYISNTNLTPKVNDKGLKIGYKLRDQNGDLNLKRFINTLDYSLDLIKMQEVYESLYRRSVLLMKICHLRIVLQCRMEFW